MPGTVGREALWPAPLSVKQVLEILGDPRSVLDLRRYFTPDPAPGSPAFAGRRFESLGTRGPQEDDRNRFTAADPLAVQCLSVTVPIDVALDLLEGDLGLQMSGLLSQIPTDLVLGTGTRGHWSKTAARPIRHGVC